MQGEPVFVFKSKEPNLFCTYILQVILMFFNVSSDPAWNTLWPQERKRQRAFFLFGLALIVQLDIEGIRTFFRTFFRLPDWYDQFPPEMMTSKFASVV